MGISEGDKTSSGHLHINAATQRLIQNIFMNLETAANRMKSSFQLRPGGINSIFYTKNVHKIVLYFMKT